MVGVPRRARETEKAVAEAAPVDAAREAAGGRPAGPAKGDPLLGELRRAGLLPMLVLHFLGEGPSYGNQLMERVSQVTGGLVAVNPNTMYPLLRSLEGRGLIAGEWEHPERRSRRFYRLTPEGETERERLADEIAPHLDAVARSVELIRTEIGRG
jgi:PadR family transcriptional regulator, regulatory protein PadR